MTNSKHPTTSQQRLNEAETGLLEDKLRDEKRQFPGWLLAVIGLAAVIPLFPGKRGHYGGFLDLQHFKVQFLGRFLLGLLLFLPLCIGKFVSTTRRLKRDLADGLKSIEEAQVVKKMKVGSHQFMVWLDCAEASFKTLKVSDYEYDALAVGDKVILEFAPHSKHLFRPPWKT